MQLEQKIEQLITPALDDMGFSLVRVKFREGALQIMAERKGELGMNLDDCGKIAKVVSAILDVEDVIKSKYDLEVSSPGIDRPLTKLKDFEKFTGYEAKLQASVPVEGRKKFIGRIKKVENEEILFVANDQLEKIYRIDFNNIASAKLVINNELLKAAANN